VTILIGLTNWRLFCLCSVTYWTAGRVMAFKFAVRPPFSFQFFYKRNLPVRIQAGKCLLFRFMQAQATEGIPAKPFKEIPGPKGLPIIGTLLDYVRDQGEGVSGYKRMHVMQQQRIQQFGSIYREKIVLATKTWKVTICIPPINKRCLPSPPTPPLT